MISDKTVVFGDGLNVIEGDNETGKSTIGAFIKFIFYGMNKADRERYVSWGAPGCSGSLTVESEGRIFTIERELLLNRTKDRINIVSEHGEIVRTDKAPWELFLGVPENVFINTSFTGTLDSSVGGQGLPEAIENIIFSADEAVSTKKALKTLDEQRVALLYKNQKGGRIYELENHIAELECKLSSATKASEQIFTLDESIRTKREKLRSNKEKIKLITAQLEDYDIYKRLLELENHEKAEKELKDAEKEVAELQAEYTENGFLPDRSYIDELKTLEANEKELKETADRCSRELSEAEAKIGSADSKNILRIASSIGGVEAMRKMYDAFTYKKSSFKKRAVILFVLAGLFAAAAVPCILFVNTISAVAAGAVALVLLIAGISCAVQSSKLKTGLEKLAAKLGAEEPEEIPELLEYVADAGEKTEHFTAEYNEKLEKKRAADKRLSDIRSKIKEYTAKCGRSEESVSAVITLLEGHLANLSEANTRLQMAQYKVSVTKKDRDTTAEELRSKLNKALSIEEISTFKYDEKRTELNLLLGANESLSEKINADTQTLAAANATFTLPSSIYAKLNAARAELAELYENHKACMMAFEKLNEASVILRNSISPTLAKDASAYMNGFSGGKYDSLGVSSKLEITYGSAGMTHPVQTLSTGTQDMAYISLRLALIKMLYPKKAPAFFDDTFAHIDNTRMQRIISTLAASDQQSVIFTCHEREGAFAAGCGGAVTKMK